MPNVSVSMSTYNEDPARVESSLDSILNQTYREFELLVVIDCPENHAVRALLNKNQQADSRITVIQNQENLGLVASLNRALDMAKGQYICRMDADDISMPNRIKTQLTFLTEHDLDLIGGRMTVVDEDGNDLYDIPQPPVNPESVARALRWNNCVPHPTWFGKKTLFQQSYRTIPLCEDYDFLLRASLSGARIANCDSIVLKYRMTAGSISRTSLYRQFLYQRYITKAYRRHEVANPREAKQYVNSSYSESKATRYEQANNTFNGLLNSLSERNILRSIAYSFRLLFCSASYLNKIVRLALVSMN